MGKKKVRIVHLFAVCINYLFSPVLLLEINKPVTIGRNPNLW